MNNGRSNGDNVLPERTKGSNIIERNGQGGGIYASVNMNWNEDGTFDVHMAGGVRNLGSRPMREGVQNLVTQQLRSVFNVPLPWSLLK
jgi:hypothetical protein